jgi:hypothetical protein
VVGLAAWTRTLLVRPAVWLLVVVAGAVAALAGFAGAGICFLTTIVDVASASAPAAAVLDVAAVAVAAPDVPAAAVPDIPADAIPHISAVAVAILVAPFLLSKLFMALC